MKTTRQSAYAALLALSRMTLASGRRLETNLTHNPLTQRRSGCQPLDTFRNIRMTIIERAYQMQS